MVCARCASVVMSCELYAALIAAGAGRSLAAIFTKSAREWSFIVCIALPQCAFTVIPLQSPGFDGLDPHGYIRRGP